MFSGESLKEEEEEKKKRSTDPTWKVRPQVRQGFFFSFFRGLR